LIDVALDAAVRVREVSAKIEVARTGPRSSGLRTTGAVSRDIIEGSRSTLLVVGYSVTVDSDRSGLAAKTIDTIAAAAGRGVVVTAVLHRVARNRSALLSSWPGYAKQPSIFTWPAMPNDDMTKLHAKVLVADATDAFVTSANLTYHGMQANIELGVRVTGPPAALVEEHFRDLIRTRELISWDA
jgi:phosphatidylserine/phosphatidylglycerophosphate/cardiolipin synthase-like enzyme